MGFRLRKSIRIAPGVRINVSKSGIGISAGVKGVRVGTGPRGTYVSTNITGAGIGSTHYVDRVKTTRVPVKHDVSNLIREAFLDLTHHQKIEPRFEELIEKIRQIEPSIQITIPNDPASVKKQIKEIIQAQKDLRAIKSEVYGMEKGSGNKTEIQVYRAFKTSIEALIVDGDRFKLLAKEYLQKPEETIIKLHREHQAEKLKKNLELQENQEAIEHNRKNNFDKVLIENQNKETKSIIRARSKELISWILITGVLCLLTVTVYLIIPDIGWIFLTILILLFMGFIIHWLESLTRNLSKKNKNK